MTRDSITLKGVAVNFARARDRTEEGIHSIVLAALDVTSTTALQASRGLDDTNLPALIFAVA